MFVFMVGLPRSGSTLVSKYLNEDKRYISLNDFYLIQKLLVTYALHSSSVVEAHEEVCDYFEFFLTERVKVNDPFEGQLTMSDDELATAKNIFRMSVPSAITTRTNYIRHYYDLVQKVFVDAIIVDKTPQNFMNYELISQVFPDSKFIYLIRNPYDTALSFKYSNFKGHDRRRYHPYVYAKYWVKAVTSFRKHSDAAVMIKYEDVVESGSCVIVDCIKRLSLEISITDINYQDNNSSSKSKERRMLTGLETSVITKVCGAQMDYLNYVEKPSVIRISDFYNIFIVTLRFLNFNMLRFIREKDSRNRIMKFMFSR